LQAAWTTEIRKLNLKNIPKHPDGLFILGLGKLGGLDLNFSSDVDLVAFYDPVILPIPISMGQTYVVDKVLKKLGQILNPRNKPKFIWRVDWRLRPESSASQLAMSVDMARDFYFFRALPWHRLALMKAEVIAGDITSGKTFLTEIETFIWRKNLDFRSLDDLAYLKSRINLEHPDVMHESKLKDYVNLGTSNFNVKLGKGGIREIEFITNAMQLIWGGKQSQLRTTNTLKALSELTKLNHIEYKVFTKLTQSYKRLRTIENIIQLMGNEQVHTLPKNDNKKDKILKILEVSDWKTLDKEIIQIRNFVHSEFNKLFIQDDPKKLSDKKQSSGLGSLKPNIRDIANNWLNGFIPIAKDPVKFQPLGKALLNQIFTASVNADEAIFRMNNFLSHLSRSEQYLDLLYRNQKLLDALVPPIIHSSHMTLLLEQSPHIIDIFLYPENEMDISHLFSSNDYGSRLESLRRFVNEHLYLHYTKFLSKGGCEKLLFKNLTYLADTTIKAAGEFKRHHRPACIDTQEKTHVIGAGFMREHAHVNRDARRLQDRNALAADARVAVCAGDHNARDISCHKRIGAGRGLAGMGAGFERDIDRRALGRRPRLPQGFGFGVGSAARLGPSPSDDAALLHNDAAHGGVGPDSPLPAPAQRQGQRHKARVVRHTYSSAGVSGRSSCTNLSKSSAA